MLRQAADCGLDHRRDAHEAEPVAQEPDAPIERRPVYFADEGWLDTPVYDREALAAGTRLAGPAIINQFDSTTVVPPFARVEIDEWLNIRIHLTEFKNEEAK